MPVPKRKRSHARIAKAHANKGLKLKAFTCCANCKEVLPSHQACGECGYYKGIKVLVTRKERTMHRLQTRREHAERKKKYEKSSAPAAPSQE
jgi:large subunit ribosomal protein L32